MGNEEEDERVSQGNEPNWDINRAQGAQAELWVLDLCKTLAEGKGAVEVKAPKPFLRFQAQDNEGPYVEYACCHSGEWRPSGIAKTQAQLWLFTFGSLPGGLVVETQWLKRACRTAYRKGQLKEEKDGSHPTKGVIVNFVDLWETRDHNP